MEKPPTGLWGVTANIVPLFGGHRNRAFRTLGLDNDLVFKTTRRDAAAIEWLAPVFSLAEENGFIVPYFLKSRTGRYIEQGWTCEPFIHGETFFHEDMSSIGLQLSLFQKATKNIPQRPGFLSARDLVDRDLGGDVDLRDMPSKIVALCREAWSQIGRCPMCVVHGDLSPNNLIWTKGGRVAVLDWDECRVDAALFDTHQISLSCSNKMIEMAVVAWEVACSWNLEPEYALKAAGKLTQMAQGRPGSCGQ